MDNDNLEPLHVKEPEQITLTDDLFGDLLMEVQTPSPAVTPGIGVAFLPLQNELNKPRLVDNVDRIDRVTIAAQQFHALKAAGVNVPDIFDKNYQGFEDKNKGSSGELHFSNNFLDEDESHRQSKDKHPRMRPHG